MKEKMIYGLLVFFLVALMGTPALYVERGVAEIDSQAEENDSDPSAFEGDSDSTPGERAPENLPMADAPADAGMGVQ